MRRGCPYFFAKVGRSVDGERCQMSDVRWQLTVDSWPLTVDRCQMSDVRCQSTVEIDSWEWRLVVGSWQLMVDSWWLTVDGWWLMVDGWWLMVDGVKTGGKSKRSMCVVPKSVFWRLEKRLPTPLLKRGGDRLKKSRSDFFKQGWWRTRRMSRQVPKLN